MAIMSKGRFCVQQLFSQNVIKDYAPICCSIFSNLDDHKTVVANVEKSTTTYGFSRNSFY